MLQKLLFSFVLLLLYTSLSAQHRQQYFDGADTNMLHSLYVHIDTTGGNTWQIGKPDKLYFALAATVPNVIVTDTLHPHPINDTSSFTVGISKDVIDEAYWGILAIRWYQKLDLVPKHGWGMVEFSIDTGNTWQNAFDNPYVYNFYGFNASNVDTIHSSKRAFTGTDINWRDIWFCFSSSYLSLTDSMIIRYTFISDSVDSAKSGWMIDNFLVNITYAHTLVKTPHNNDKIMVYPTITSNIVNIEAPKVAEFHIIEDLQLINVEGKVVQQHKMCPTKFYIDVSGHPSGMYYLKVKTNLYSGTYPVYISR